MIHHSARAWRADDAMTYALGGARPPDVIVGRQTPWLVDLAPVVYAKPEVIGYGDVAYLQPRHHHRRIGQLAWVASIEDNAC